MADYELSTVAANALEEIFIYTDKNYGQNQALAYHEGFHRIFELLSDFPHMGKSAQEYAEGLRQFNHGSHAIFYTLATNHTVRIEQILHHSQEIRRHMFDY